MLIAAKMKVEKANSNHFFIDLNRPRKSLMIILRGSRRCSQGFTLSLTQICLQFWEVLIQKIF